MALKTAMIDVGGGFRAIFGCGVMDRMLEDGIDVDMCYGVSAGGNDVSQGIRGGRSHSGIPREVTAPAKYPFTPNRIAVPRWHARWRR